MTSELAITELILCQIDNCMTMMKVKSKDNQPSRQVTLRQRRINVDATSWRCIDVDTTLYKRHVPAGSIHIYINIRAL